MIPKRRKLNKKAIKLAIECIRKEIQCIAVDANLHEMYGANSPHAKRCSKRRKELLGVIEELEKEKNKHEMLMG